MTGASTETPLFFFLTKSGIPKTKGAIPVFRQSSLKKLHLDPLAA